MVLVEESAVECGQGLPLGVGEIGAPVPLRLLLIDFPALALHHDEPGVDPLDLGDLLAHADMEGVELPEERRARQLGFHRSAAAPRLGWLWGLTPGRRLGQKAPSVRRVNRVFLLGLLTAESCQY